LTARGVAHDVICLGEPGRFRAPRDHFEAAACVPHPARAALFGDTNGARVFVTHTRPDALLGVLRPLDTGARTRALGYLNHGGTLDALGMLFANRCTWAHVVAEAAAALGVDVTKLLDGGELAAVAGEGDPTTLR
jgi:phosphoketolase